MSQILGRPIRLEDARLIISGWVDSDALLRCDAEVGPAAFVMTSRFRPLTDWPLNVAFRSDDDFAGMAFAIKPDFRFIYFDPREFPEGKHVVCALYFFFPSSSDYPDDDFLQFSELKTP